MSKRYCLALDLKADSELIRQYEWYHSAEGIWPEILESLRVSGIQKMEIYRTGNRLTMLIEVSDDFSFEKKSAMDKANERVQAWETLMSQFQQRLPWAQLGEKWVLMDCIFEFKSA
ncbi:MAG TPA: L-rhamnose mutarotase [Saprospiraceae bacterium]|mgnify:CR=1 FL=1|nr:L-rhamnose mutarotase [Saprospiraceae bacterium]HMQ84472.1 L-rhamnose mutarotase [Saprospiraceae bacterium]